MLILPNQTAASTLFKDVNYRSEVGKSIQWGVNEGLLKGYSDTVFKPHQQMTEGQLLRVLNRYAYGYPEHFTMNQYYSIFQQSTNHEFNGYTNKKSRVSPVARIEVARNLYQLAHVGLKEQVNDQIIIDWMYHQGITKGKGVYPNDRYLDFGGSDILTRGQVTAFFHRFNKTQKLAQINDNRVAGMSLGDSSEVIKRNYPKASLKVKNEQELYWNVHHKNYRELFTWSEKNGKVVSLFTTHPGLYKDQQGVKIGMTQKEVEQRKGRPSRIFEGKRTVYELSDRYITFFFDYLNGGKLTGVLIHSKSLPNYHSLSYSPNLVADVKGNEQFVFLLLNNTRVEAGLHPLKWNASVARMAKLHSEDMVKNNYFSHNSLSGETYAARIKKHRIPIAYASENISSGYVSPIFSHNGLVNSPNHRQNVFCPIVQEVGIGIAYDAKLKPKYTHNYVKIKR